jgi:hypothetical protein
MSSLSPRARIQSLSLGIVDAASVLHQVLCATATSAMRPFEVHCVRFTQVSLDEALLLWAAAAAQQDQLDIALAYLQDWLPMEHAKRSVGALCVFSTLVKTIGLVFPLRRECEEGEISELPKSSCHPSTYSTLH